MSIPVRSGAGQTQVENQLQRGSLDFFGRDAQKQMVQGGVLAVVADGKDKALGGELSDLAVQTFLKDYQAKVSGHPIPDALLHALHAAHEAVCAFAETQGKGKNCDTSLAAVMLDPQTRSCHWISIGGSRVYLLRNARLTPVTLDSSYGNSLLRKEIKGALWEGGRPAKADLQRWSAYLGMRKLAEIDRSIKPFPLHTGDKLLVCNEGVHQSLSDAQLSSCLHGEPELACARVIKEIEALARARPIHATLAMLVLDSTPVGRQPRSKRLWLLPLLVLLGAAGYAYFTHPAAWSIPAGFQLPAWNIAR